VVSAANRVGVSRSSLGRVGQRTSARSFLNTKRTKIAKDTKARFARG
jgi:hypothetical protein